MAKHTVLTERGTGETLYPQTLAEFVQMSDGGDVEKALAELPLKVFVDMWLERGLIYSGARKDEAILLGYRWSQYDPVGHPEEPYGLNGMWLSYGEAVTVMAVPDVVLGPEDIVPMRNFHYSRARTLFPIKGSFQSNMAYVLNMMPNIEVVRFVNYYIINNGADPDTYPQQVTATRDAIYQCPKLREVRGVLKLSANDNMNRHFYNSIGATALETIWLQGVCLDMDLRQWGKLRIDCVAYMVEYAANTKAITITLHPDVYARIPEETFKIAAEKNITFATT